MGVFTQRAGTGPAPRGDADRAGPLARTHPPCREREDTLTSSYSTLAALLLAALTACSSSDPEKTCADFCGAGSTCNTVNDTCVSTSTLHDSFGALTDGVPGPLRGPFTSGNPVATVNLAVAARDIRMPTRTNCGACHFYAGGGDNVKLMGSSLRNPTEAIDVHMGRGMECLDCHADLDHTFKGAGVHVPAHTARVSCADCHGAAPHEGKVQAGGENLDTHAVKLGCQTCHIPKFSKGQFGKMDWDWSTAGNNTLGTAGVITTKVNDDGSPNPASLNAVVTYDYIKGNFLWQKNVAPAYAWSNGKSTHARTSDKADFTAAGLTPADADRISLGEPVGSPANGKIMPFKLMKGRQAVYVDGANGFVVTPNVFGPGSFWAVIQATTYSFATYDFDGTGPIAAGQPSVDALWGKILATGAVAAGQVPAGTTALAKFDAAAPTVPGYDWRYTKLYMDLNHEVAPKAQALGANNACGDCHAGTGNKLPLCQLYGGTPPAGLWGVTCP